MKKNIILSTLLISLCGGLNEAYAIDTLELLDKGVIETGPSLTLDNIRDGKPSLGASIELLYGVSDWMTLSSFYSIYSDEALAGGQQSGGISTSFTPIDTEQFDFDTTLEIAYDGGLAVTPSFEFNFDSNNDMSFMGAFLTLGLPIASSIVEDEKDATKTSDEKNATKTSIESDVGIDIDFGGYWTIGGGDHQLLASGGVSIANLAKNLGDREYSYRVGLGYNVVIREAFELWTELLITIPEKTKDTCAGLSIGGIFDFNTKATTAVAEADI